MCYVDGIFIMKTKDAVCFVAMNLVGCCIIFYCEYNNILCLFLFYVYLWTSVCVSHMPLS